MLILIVVLLFLVLLWLVLGYRIANLLLYANHQPILYTPADCGLEYEDVTFRSKDRLRLRGWWIPAAHQEQLTTYAPVVILLHPMFGNRHGLASKHQSWPFLINREINLLETAKAFHQAGFAVLMFDFRSHGESQRALCAGGLTEDQDVMGAVDYIFERIAPED